jgi:hypothetical protein
MDRARYAKPGMLADDVQKLATRAKLQDKICMMTTLDTPTPKNDARTQKMVILEGVIERDDRGMRQFVQQVLLSLHPLDLLLFDDVVFLQDFHRKHLPCRHLGSQLRRFA